MGDLARALIQDGALTPEAAARAAAASPNRDLASAALELRLADEAALVRALSRLYECPGVDLSRSVVPSANLSVVASDFCRERRVLPVSVGQSEVALAMADPEDLASADEVRFFTGKKVLRYVAVGLAIERALTGLLLARRDRALAWRGERAAALADPTAAHLAAVKPTDQAGVDLPDAREEMEVVGLAEVVGPFEPVVPGVPPPPTGPSPPGAASPPSVASPSSAAAPGPAERSTRLLEGLAVGKVALVADDDQEVRKLVAAVLTNMGCVVQQAGDGKRALEMVRESHPDLVVLDAMMPGMHGFEVCRAIKADRVLRACRVILCSAIYRGTVGTDAQVAFGADAFVEKPFRLEELARVFRVALVGPAAAESAAERAAREEAVTLWRGSAEALAQGRDSEAAELARDAATKDPWSAEAHYYLGHALARQGLLLEAVAAYERAAELRPDVDASHQCLAQTYEQLGFQKSAREAWARAIETCRDPARTKSMQARLMALLGVQLRR